MRCRCTVVLRRMGPPVGHGSDEDGTTGMTAVLKIDVHDKMHVEPLRQATMAMESPGARTGHHESRPSRGKLLYHIDWACVAGMEPLPLVLRAGATRITAIQPYAPRNQLSSPNFTRS